MPGLRAAILGAGFVAGVHARSIRLAGGEIAGVVASTPERSREAAKALGAQRAFESAEAAVAADVDVVHVCTPNHLHAPAARAALEAGRHVVCEKPLGLDAAQAEGLAALARTSDRAAAVPFVYRYYPTVAEARERVRSGSTGPIRLLHGCYLQDWLLTEEDDNWRTDERLGGASRAFADIGSHWCDLARFITGVEIARVVARTTTVVAERRRAAGRAAFSTDRGDGRLEPVTTEDAAAVLFETAGGVVGSVVVSQVSAGRKNRLWIEVDGAHEALVFDQEEPETLWCGRRESTTLLRRAPETLSPGAQRWITLPGGHPQGYADCFDAFVADVYGSIEAGADPPSHPGFDDGLVAARITDAVLESHRTGGWVDVAHARAPAG